MQSLLNIWREGALVGLVVLLVTSVTQCQRRSTELKQLRLALENPATKETARETASGGEEVTVTRTWTRTPPPPAARTTKKDPEKYAALTETVHWKAPVTVTRESGRESTPVSVSSLLPAGRHNRWLLSAGVTRIDRGIEGKALLAGYGWGNRFDLQAGAFRLDGETHPLVMGTLRF